MLFILKSFVSYLQADHIAKVLKKSGLKVFARIGNWRALAVPGMSKEDAEALTRWERATIDQIKPIEGSFDPEELGFADVDAVLV